MAYILKCRDFRYEVTPKVENILLGVIFWKHVETLTRKEWMVARKKDSRYTEEEVRELEHTLNECELTIRDLMTKMEKNNVPNWVGNGAMYWGETHDLRQEYIRHFFTNSIYAGGTV